MTLDASGNAYIVGDTLSTILTTTPGAFDTTCGTDGTCNAGHYDAFLTKISATADLKVTNSAPRTTPEGKV